MLYARCIHVGSGTATILETESEWKVDLEGMHFREDKPGFVPDIVSRTGGG